jgi:hypothetical protein
MPEYLAPAVFVEETSFRAKSIEGVGTSTAAFVGMTARGPVSVSPSDPTPPLLTSFGDFERYYGGVDDLVVGLAGTPAGRTMSVPNYVALAARAFFSNGGGRLYVARIPGTGGTRATSGSLNEEADPDDQVSFTAREPSGARFPDSDVNLRVIVRQDEIPVTKKLALRQPAGTLFRINTADPGDEPVYEYFIIGVDAPAVDPSVTPAPTPTAFQDLGDDGAGSIVTLAVEVHDASGLVYESGGLGVHEQSPRHVGRVLGPNPPNSSDALGNPTQIIIGADVDAAALRLALTNPDGSPKDILLKGGLDGAGAPASGGNPATAGWPSTATYQEALDSLLALEDVSIVAAPGASSFDAVTAAAVNQSLIGHAEARRAYRIAVLDPPPALEIAEVRALKSKIDSKYAALYYPWIRIANPLAGPDPNQPSTIDVPPSGAVCGIYARSDVQRGVWKAPANETVTGALGLQRDVRFGEQEVLNPLGINCIRTFPNRGIRVWGARTLSSDPEWKYVNIRRYFLYLEASIDRGTQWAVFEPNGEALWANVRTTVSDFLYNEWVSGALLGSTDKEAFFVHCDRSTITQNDLDNGRLVCLVGVAAIKPAEFVIFRIGQKTADARG